MSGSVARSKNARTGMLPASRLVAPVLSACEAVWQCQNVDAAQHWIGILHKAILKDKIDSFDPSEAFLALQGAALRFKPHSGHHEHEGQDSSSHEYDVDDTKLGDFQSRILAATASLARRVVGPAWWHQFYTRRNRLRQADWRPAEEDAQLERSNSTQTSAASHPARDQSLSQYYPSIPVDFVVGSLNVENSSVRSSSPMTEHDMPIVSDGQLKMDSISSYPGIPEVLPAAMLRFAASFEQDDYGWSVSRAQSQMIIVTALCCRPELADDEWTMAAEWSIVGVQHGVTKMAESWLVWLGPLSANQSESWNLRLQIARTVADLLSSGWHPPLKSRETVVDALLHLSKDTVEEMDIKSVDGSAHGSRLTLAVSSTLAETVSALAAMASRDLVPDTHISKMVDMLCFLYVMVARRQNNEASGTVAVSSTLSLEERQEFKIVWDSIKGQYEAAFADISTLIWVLLARPSTSSKAMESLLHLVEEATTATWTQDELTDVGQEWSFVETLRCMKAGAALRVLGSALWGKPPDISSIALLRIFWKPLLETVLCLLSNLHERIADTIEYLLQPEPFRDLTALAIEGAILLGRAIEKEIRGGPAILANTEWDTIALCLSDGVLPILLTVVENRCNEDTARFESTVQSLLLLLGDFFGKCIEEDSTPFVEYERQRRLYLLLLQVGLPSSLGEDAALMSIVVFQCWSKFGFSPYRIEGCTKTGVELLKEAFRQDERGEYAHAPEVRLAAFEALTFASEADTMSRKKKVIPRRSVLTSTQNMRELHLELINAAIIPSLKKIFESSFIRIDESSWLAPNVVPASTNDSVPSNESVAILLETAALSAHQEHRSTEALTNYAINVTGRLFRDITGDRETRLLYINLLRTLAVNEKGRVPYSVRIFATIELHRCLAALFGELPHAHAKVPVLIDALTDVLNMCSCEFSKCIASSDYFLIVSAQAIAALYPIASLRVAIDQHVSLKASYVPTELRDLFSVFLTSVTSFSPEDRSPVVDTYGAPFLIALDARSNHTTSEITEISFSSVLSSLVGFLSGMKIHTSPLAAYMQQCIRISCYDMLLALAMAKTDCLISNESFDCIFRTSMAKRECRSPDEIECLTRSQVLGQIFHNRLILINDFGHDEPIKSFLEPMQEILGILAEACLSTHWLDYEPAYGVFCSVVPALQKLCQRIGLPEVLTNWSEIIERGCLLEEKSCLMLMSQCSTSSRPRLYVALLALVHDFLLCNSFVDMNISTRNAVSRLCCRIIQSPPEGSDHLVHHLALRCMMILLGSTKQLDENPLQSSGKSDKIESSLHGDNDFSFVTREISRRHLLCKDRSISSLAFHDRPLSKHEMLAKELADLERFVVNEENGRKLSASWILSEAILLTCRIGSDNSRYRGWCEVVLRTITLRRRILVRLPGYISLESPDFPPSLWLDRDITNLECQNQDTMIDQKNSLFTQNDTLKRARAAISRFDLLVTSLKETDKISAEKVTGTMEKSVQIFPRSYQAGDKCSEIGDISEWLSSVLEGNGIAVRAVFAEIDPFFGYVEDINASPKETTCNSQPRRLENGARLDRAISVLDRTSLLSTYKFGLLYDCSADSRQNQSTFETSLLFSTACSPSFYKSLNNLGKVVPTKQLKHFSGGLDASPYSSDGIYALMWMDDDPHKTLVATSMAVFHACPMMPDDKLQSRKRHVGNDNVLILFSDRGSDILVDLDSSGRDLNRSVVGGAFGFVTIFVTAPRSGLLRIAVRLRTGLSTRLNSRLSSLVGHTIMEETVAPTYVRNLAMRADLICRSAVDTIDPPSNCIDRYHQLRDMKRFALKP